MGGIGRYLNMRPLLKTSIAAVLFLVPLAMVCQHQPMPEHSELVPLPFKVQPAVVPQLSAEELDGGAAVLLQQPSPGYISSLDLQHSKPQEAQKLKKFSFNYGALAVEDRDAVRLKGAKVGVDYHVDDQHSVGVESSQQIYDRQDAKAWGESGKDESTAGIKYKLIF